MTFNFDYNFRYFLWLAHTWRIMTWANRPLDVGNTFVYFIIMTTIVMRASRTVIEIYNVIHTCMVFYSIFYT